MGTKTVGRFTTDGAAPIVVAGSANILFTSSTISTKAIAYNAATGEISIKAPGLYMIFANFTPVATVVGPVSVQAFEDGVAVPGAKSFNALAAVGNTGNLSFNAVTTVECACPTKVATLTFKNLNPTSYSVANVIVEKIA